MLSDTKKRIESSIRMHNDKSDSKLASKSIQVITQVVIGNPAEVIIDIANTKQKVDLIIMGSIGLKGISKIRVLGSVSRHICENANCPVMTGAGYLLHQYMGMVLLITLFLLL